MVLITVCVSAQFSPVYVVWCFCFMVLGWNLRPCPCWASHNHWRPSPSCFPLPIHHLQLSIQTPQILRSGVPGSTLSQLLFISRQPLLSFSLCRLRDSLPLEPGLPSCSPLVEVNKGFSEFFFLILAVTLLLNSLFCWWFPPFQDTVA